MANNVDIEMFAKDEYVVISINAKNRDGTALTDADTHLISFVISYDRGGDPLLTFSTDTGHIVLDDLANARFLLHLDPSDLSTIEQDTVMWYHLWSEKTPATPVLQAYGKFTLQESAKY